MGTTLWYIPKHTQPLSGLEYSELRGCISLSSVFSPQKLLVALLVRLAGVTVCGEDPSVQ